MKEIQLEFSFKGDRNYVHGTDVYMKIIKEMNLLGYGEWKSMELNIKRICHHNLTCFLSEKKQVHEDEVINFTLKKDTGRIYGSIIENPDKVISSRYPFREEDIFRYAHVDYEQESITYNNPQNTFYTIEIILAIAKLYLEKAVDDSVKWYFRRITLSRPIGEIETHSVHLQKASQKNGFIGFDLFIGNKQFGEGYAAAIPSGISLQ